MAAVKKVIKKKAPKIATKDMIVWKAAYYYNENFYSSRALVKLKIRKGTQIRMHYGDHRLDRKCRAAEAKVLHIHDDNGKPIKCQVRSGYDGRFYYKVGEVIKPKRLFDKSHRICGSGIHFFLDIEDAKWYGLR